MHLTLNSAESFPAPLAVRCYSHAKVETDEEFDSRWVTYFSKPDLDTWELRKGMNTLIGYDLVPEPKILDSALRACRRLNDLASAIRILEAVKVRETNAPLEKSSRFHLKSVVHPKIKCGIFRHPPVIQDQDEFVPSSGLWKCSTASVSQQWMLCSEWVPSE
uniref:Cytochrome c oxidase subunit 5A, mitochondrial n=1 Tax=Cyprinus carpio TaxID=7962 RepID=A0A8C1TWA2_CYPCA